MVELKVTQIRPSRTLHLLKKQVGVHQETIKPFAPDESVFVPDHTSDDIEKIFMVENNDSCNLSQTPCLITNRSKMTRTSIGKTKDQSEHWDVKSLEIFFTSIQLPEVPFRLNNWTVITDLKLFVKAGLLTVKQNNGNSTYRPYYDRLISLKEILSNNLSKHQ